MSSAPGPAAATAAGQHHPRLRRVLPAAGPLTASEVDQIMTCVTDEAAHIAALIDGLACAGPDQTSPPPAASAEAAGR
jgi:hypothetical protein